MLKRIASLGKHRYILVVAGVLIIICLVFIIDMNQKSAPPLTVPQLYQKELTSLSNDLTELSAYIDKEREINEDLNQYTSGLNNLKNPCRQMNIYHDRYQNQELTNQVKDAMSNGRQLCTDFLDVLDYSQAVFRAIGPYITINTEHWPYASSAEFTGHMQNIDKIISGTLDGLKNTKNTVQDPALAELISQVELADAKLKQVQKAYLDGDKASADIYTDELIALIEQDKTDFINARSYFWRNTVQIEALHKSVETLSKSFQVQ
jgi:hypothetical protein